MKIAHRWVDRNLTRMELVVAILILALLIGMFSKYMFVIFAKAERSMVNRTVININTALHYRASMMVMMGQDEELNLLLKINPMKELQLALEINDIQNKSDMLSYAFSGSVISTPSNYGGTVLPESLDTMEKGKWYFRSDNHVLLYTLNNTEYFSDNFDGIARIRYRIKLDYIDNNNNGKYDQKIDEYNSLKLKKVNDNTWKI
jgi:hypothetical protein